jgi:hypothetical protein
MTREHTERFKDRTDKERPNAEALHLLYAKVMGAKPGDELKFREEDKDFPVSKVLGLTWKDLLKALEYEGVFEENEEGPWGKVTKKIEGLGGEADSNIYIGAILSDHNDRLIESMDTLDEMLSRIIDVSCRMQHSEITESERDVILKKVKGFILDNVVMSTREMMAKTILSKALLEVDRFKRWGREDLTTQAIAKNIAEFFCNNRGMLVEKAAKEGLSE